MTQKFYTIDPPEGWKYGFPKEITEKEYNEIKDWGAWCMEKGYPKEKAAEYGDYFHIGFSGPYEKETVSKPEQATNKDVVQQLVEQMHKDNEDFYNKYQEIIKKDRRRVLIAVIIAAVAIVGMLLLLPGSSK